MADAPAKPSFTLAPRGDWIGIPFNQTYGGQPSPYADSGAQLLDTMRISGLLGPTPPNNMLNNAAARYDFKNTGIKAGINPNPSPYKAPWDRNPVFSTGFGKPPGIIPPGPPGGPPPGGGGGGGPLPGGGGHPLTPGGGILPTGNPTFNPDGSPVTTFTYPENPHTGGTPGKTGNWTGGAMVKPTNGDMSQASMEAANPQFFSWARSTAKSLGTPLERYSFTKQTPGLNWTDSGLTRAEWNAADEQATGGGAGAGLIGNAQLQALIASGRSFWGA